MASNGFAPPAPRPATVETVETGATAKTSSTSSSHPVAAFHTRLIEELLADLRSLPPSRPTHQDKTLAEAFRKADSWGSLRILLRAQFGPPGVALLNGDVETVTATGQVVLAALDRIGAAQLARECSDLDDHNASPTRRTDASGPPAGNGGGVWHGLCELLAWLSAVRCAFVGETVNTTPAIPGTVASAAAVKVEPASSRSPVVSPQPSFGFAPPPQPGRLAQKHEDQQTKVNIAAPTPALPSQPMPPPEAKPAQASTAAAPVAQERPPRPPVAPVPVSVQAAGSKAAAFAMRMSGLSGPPAVAAADVAPIASTSTLPTGPPSAGFAPPPAPGASAFDKKPKARVWKPRVSAPAAGAGAGADETRPKRERKISVKIRDASTSNGGDSPPDEIAQSSSYKGKKRFTSYDEPSESDHDDGELDELASDYEEQLERKRRKLDASGGGGSGSDASKKQRPRTKAPRDPAAEKAHRLALLAKEEAELAQDPKRFKVGQAVIARFPNYSYWPAMVLDPLTAPPKTQGTRVKGAYLVKSIPTGADHRWVPPDDSSILLVTTTQLDDIILGRYKSAPPPSWKKWRGELVDAAMMIKDEARLKEWAAHPTPTELWHIAQAERKKAARASAAW